MNIRISIFKFLELLEEFYKNFCHQMKNDNIYFKTYKQSNPQNIKDSLNPNFHNDNIFNIENKFTKEFSNFHLLINEKKQNLSNLLNNESQMYCINSNNLTKYDIINRQKIFLELFTKWFENFKQSIQEKLNLFKEKGIVIESNSNTNYKYLNFNNKSEYEQFIRKNGKLDVLIENISKEKYLYKFFKELYLCLKEIKNFTISENLKIETLTRHLQERMTLIFYDIAKRNYDEEDFELHKAVYENNLRMIRKICASEITSHLNCEINELDPNGNTPLMLAIKLKNLDAINVLCDHEADIKHKCFEGDISPIEYARLNKNKEILKILINGVKKQKISNWENNKKEVLDLIKNIPDFSMELKLNFDSNIFSLFSSITPSDNYKVFKSGGNLRIDLNISSMNSSFKSIRGKCSIIVQEKGNKINVFKVDHEKKLTYDYIDYLGNSNDEDEKVERTILNGVNSRKIITKNFRFVEDKKKKEEKILNYLAVKQTLKGDVYLNKNKKKKKITNESKEKIEDDYFYLFKKDGKNFTMYFKEGLQRRNDNLSFDDEDNFTNNSLEKGISRNSKNYTNSNYLNIKVTEKENFKKIFSTKNSRKKEFNFPFEYLENEGKCKKEEEINTERKINQDSSALNLENFKKKQVELSIWISESFPIKISHFIPLIHILSFTSSEFAELKSALCSDFLPFNSFPLKICFPLGLSFYALLSVVGFKYSAPSDSTFDLPYCEKENSLNFPNTFNENNLDLDKNYATDFYDRYYEEQKISNQNGGLDELDRSTSSNFDRLREMFLTHNDDEKVKEIKEKNGNFEDNFKDNDDEIIENIYSNQDSIQKSNDINHKNIKIIEIPKLSHPISPISNAISNINFIDVNFGFFNGELHVENGAVEEIHEENRNSNGLVDDFDHGRNPFKNFSKNYPPMGRKDCIFLPLEKSLDKFLEFASDKNLNKENKLIKFPQTPRKLKFIKFDPGKFEINQKENSNSDLTNLEMTIKLEYSPKFSKNFGIFFKNQCNKNKNNKMDKSCNSNSSSLQELYSTEKSLNIGNPLYRNLNGNNLLKKIDISNKIQKYINLTKNKQIESRSLEYKKRELDSNNLTIKKFCSIL